MLSLKLEQGLFAYFRTATSLWELPPWY